MEDIKHIIPLLIYCLIGLTVRIVIDYYRYSRRIEKDGGKFKRGVFIAKYDQDWVLGFVVVLAIAAGGEYLWHYWLGPLGIKAGYYEEVPPFAPQLGIVLGLFSTWIGNKLALLAGGSD